MCRLLFGKVLVVAEDDRRALPRRQSCERAPQGFALDRVTFVCGVGPESPPFALQVRALELPASENELARLITVRLR